MQIQANGTVSLMNSLVNEIEQTIALNESIGDFSENVLLDAINTHTDME